MGLWLSIRGFAAGVAAFVVCPCHLPLTIPLFLLVAGGTAVGGWVAQNIIIIYIASTALFIGGLALAGKWLLSGENQACAIEPKETPST